MNFEVAGRIPKFVNIVSRLLFYKDVARSIFGVSCIMKLFKNDLSKAFEILIFTIAALFFSTIALAMLSKNVLL